MTVADYLGLITSGFVNKPKFSAMVSMGVSISVRIQDILSSLSEKFDVDSAVGVQLDVVGQWVGVSRNVSIPIDNVYFSWDGTDPFVGWDYGTWQSTLTPSSVTVLPDDSYRVLIKAKIAANHWDGTTNGAYEVWEQIFTQFNILIQDHQDMSYDLAIVGGIIDSLTLALLTGGYIPLKPEGVKVNTYFIPVNSGPLFGWDLDTEFVAGWDDGSWTREIAPT